MVSRMLSTMAGVTDGVRSGKARTLRSPRRFRQAYPRHKLYVHECGRRRLRQHLQRRSFIKRIQTSVPGSKPPPSLSCSRDTAECEPRHSRAAPSRAPEPRTLAGSASRHCSCERVRRRVWWRCDSESVRVRSSRSERIASTNAALRLGTRARFSTLAGCDSPRSAAVTTDAVCVERGTRERSAARSGRRDARLLSPCPLLIR